MKYALGEVEALARKAVRGAGYSWGQAEDAGRAVRWLEAHGLPGAKALADLLELGIGANGPSENWASTGVLCPICAGTALSDFAYTLSHETPLELGEIAHPVLLVPFLATRKQSDLAWRDARFSVSENGIKITSALSAVLAPRAETVSIVLSNKAKLAPMRVMNRAMLAPALYARLDGFAHKTYAPATEASRLAGAGAGLTDND